MHGKNGEHGVGSIDANTKSWPIRKTRLLIFKVHVEKDLEGINVSCKLTIDYS